MIRVSLLLISAPHQLLSYLTGCLSSSLRDKVPDSSASKLPLQVVTHFHFENNHLKELKEKRHCYRHLVQELSGALTAYYSLSTLAAMRIDI